MIQLDKQGTPITDVATGQIVGYNTQAVLKPNFFFLDPNIVFDWDKNTCELDGEVYYLDKSTLQSSSSRSIPTIEEWKSIYGNSISYDYYTFIDNKNNPSGNQKNIYRARYFDSKQRIKYILEYSWDKNDQCATIKSLAPEGAEGQVEKEIKILRRKSEDIWLEPLSCVQGDTITLAKLPDQEIAKKQFQEWLFANGTPLPYNENDVQYIVMDTDYDIQAFWSQDITLNIHDRYQIIDSITKKFGESLSEIVLEDTETEYFNGFFYNTGEKVVFPILAQNTDIDIYSEYLEWLHVEITSQDLQNFELPNSGKIKQGDTLKLETLNELLNGITEYQDSDNPSKTWTFEGWFIQDDEASTEITSDIVDIKYDINILAKWTLV